MRHSLRLRLLVWTLALLLPLSVAAGWLLVRVFGGELLRDIDVALEEEAETLAEVLSGSVTENAAGDLLAAVAREPDLGGAKYVAAWRSGQLLGESPPGAAAVLAAPDAKLRSANAVSGRVAVRVGVSAAAALHAQRRLTSMLGAGIPLVLLALGAGLWVVLGRALWPLEDAARQLDSIGMDRLSARLAPRDPHDEVGRLVGGLNRMLERLESAVSQLQRFTADAAHELRTPLTVLRTGLEVALSRPRSADSYRAALAEALAGTERMARVAEDLLTLARLDAQDAPLAATVVELDEMLQELGDAFGAGEDGRPRVRVAVSAGIRVRGNAGDLYRLFANLIDNGLRHSYGREPVAVGARQTGDSIEVTVTDDGPGIPAPERGRVFDRFYRGSGERAAPGTGLGLSIVQEIARTHGGHVQLDNRDGGGCVATVVLPWEGAVGKAS